MVRVGVVLAGEVVLIIFRGRVRGEFFQPHVVVVEQAVLGVVDEDAGGDVHGVDEAQPLLHVALADERGDGLGDVHKAAPGRHFKPELFGERFHAGDLAAFNPAQRGQRNQSRAQQGAGERLGCRFEIEEGGLADIQQGITIVPSAAFKRGGGGNLR